MQWPGDAAWRGPLPALRAPEPQDHVWPCSGGSGAAPGHAHGPCAIPPGPLRLSPTAAISSSPLGYTQNAPQIRKSMASGQPMRGDLASVQEAMCKKKNGGEGRKLDTKERPLNNLTQQTLFLGILL